MTIERGLLIVLATTLLIGGGVMSGTGCSDCDLRVSTRMLPDAVVGIRYDVPLTSNCGGDAWFLQTGTLPRASAWRRTAISPASPR
jgi:hypothetical protein